MVKITEIMDRTDSSESESEKESDEVVLPLCRYGLSCYRKNPNHFRQFRHPHIMHSSPQDISDTPVSSTSNSNGESSSSNLKRKASSKNSVNNKNEYDAFGEHCALKLRKLEDLCPLQKIIAEKLISDVFYHAQLKSLSADSAILPVVKVCEVKKESVEVDKPLIAHIKEEVE